MFGQTVVHARQYVRPGVGGALTHQEVPVVSQQLLRFAAAHDAVVPRLAFQLLLRPEGQGTHQKRAGVVHRRCLVKTRGLGMFWTLGLDGIPEGLWCKTGQQNLSPAPYKVVSDSAGLLNLKCNTYARYQPPNLSFYTSKADGDAA